MKSTIVLFAFLSFVNIGFSQETSKKKELYTAHNKDKFTVSWGGNRDSYTKSDIRFQGKNYDFTIANAVAHDRPKGWHIDYLNPTRLTIPQTNFKLGYFITDKYSIAIAFDHMKYVLTQNQVANVSGKIDYPTGHISSGYNGVYNNTPTIITTNFLKYQHTDGLNFMSLELGRQDDISSWFGITNTDKFQLNINESIGLGLLYPKTDTELLGQKRHDDYHISGFGSYVKTGINFTFFKYFTLEGSLKAGYIDMPDVRTTLSDEDKASQHFLFFERIIAIGGIFKL